MLQPDLCSIFPLQAFQRNATSAILQTVISNQDGFLRYLLLLLGDDKVSGLETGSGSGFTRWLAARLASGEDIPLLEELTRTYSRHPKRLKEISGLVRDLSREGRNAVIPEDFLKLWAVFEAAIEKRDA